VHAFRGKGRVIERPTEKSLMAAWTSPGGAIDRGNQCGGKPDQRDNSGQLRYTNQPAERKSKNHAGDERQKDKPKD
jgi:hypothetical protein